MGLIRAAHVKRAINGLSEKLFLERHDVIVKSAAKLRKAGILAPPGPITRWATMTVMARPCEVCDSIEVGHQLVLDKTKADSVSAITGMQCVCGHCGHEGPVYEMLNPNLQARARYFAVTLWNARTPPEEQPDGVKQDRFAPA